VASAKTASRAQLKESDNRRAFQSALIGWFAQAGRDLPWRRTRDPYAILVSEFMLQQTQVTTVLGYYRRWLAQFPDVQTLAAAAPEEVLRAWEGLGYYARARNLHRAARQIVAEYGGVFPRELAQIAALPGVGRYTAGAVASFAFDTATPIVDANIARVLARITKLELPIDTAPGQRALWAAAETLLPPREARLYNSALMELGATVCQARRPQCLVCPVRPFCAAAAFGPERLPIKRARPVTISLDENCGWTLTDAGLLLQQEVGSRWRGMWKLPPLSSAPPDGEAPLFQLTYPFTHHRITLSVYPAAAPLVPADRQAWHRLDGLDKLALPAPHRRAVRSLLT
jgi:A/G-specific adenine glycosylase